jgi:UDP-2,3-diacylglucosamine pyrophosphatase LpxH
LSPQPPPDPRFRTHVRSVFLSDIHLGTADCRADLLLDFLESVQTERLYLVGDIIDLWAARRGLHWPADHGRVLWLLYERMRQGVEVICIPGNHDAELREFCGAQLGGLRLQREALHVTAQGLRLLVTHGDEFDAAVRCNRLLAAVGTHLYDVALWLNRRVNAIRNRLGQPYWSLAGYLKSRIGNAVEYVHRYEQAAAQLARHRGFDGIVCGHIHRPAVRTIDGVLYCNDGDWVDSCTALAELRSGELQLWSWSERRSPLARNAPSSRPSSIPGVTAPPPPPPPLWLPVLPPLPPAATADTVMETVATLDRMIPSLAWNVKLSAPE